MQLSGVIDWESQRHAQGTGACGAQGAMQGQISGCSADEVHCTSLTAYLVMAPPALCCKLDCGTK